jgi:ribosomal protein S18 acetylase RimI-like enzyme
VDDAPFESRRDDYLISTDPSRLDVTAIHTYLTRSYWCPGIPRELVERSVRNSLCFGLYHIDAQVGLARVITDRATYAYLCDVYVLEEHRGHALAKWLMHTVLSHPSLQGLRRFMLATRDAHGLYQQFGFREVAEPQRHMERLTPNPYDGGQSCC